jgi:ATP-binding cassette subfamily C protein LapB
MTMGGLTACMMLSSRALQPLQQSASFWIKLPAVRQAKEQIQLIADTKDHEDVCQIGDKALYNKDGEKKEAEILEPNDFEGDIQLKNLHFRYSLEDDWVLNDINLKVPAKTMVGITGPSKNGSTTMLMNLLGLLSPTQGQVLIDGMNMKDISEKSWRGKIEYLPRNGVLFKGSILDNLTSFRPHRQTIALDIASMIGLDPLVAGLTHGYETQVDSRSKISKDIIHRISMARCIITRPRILLIDKATASMDGPSEQIFLELLDKLQHSTTIILITQWPYLLGLCDQVFELKHGNMEPMRAKPSRGEAVT